MSSALIIARVSTPCRRIKKLPSLLSTFSCHHHRQQSYQCRTYATTLSTKPSSRGSPSSNPSSSSPSSLSTTSKTSTSTSKNWKPLRYARKMKEEEEGKQPDQMSSKEMLETLQRISEMEKMAPFDVWAVSVKNFDLSIPGWKSAKPGATLGDHLKTIWNTQKNWVKNAISMYRIAKVDGFPSVRVRTALSLQVLNLQKTRWLTPFRQEVFDSYQQLQRAVAIGDDKTIKKLSIEDYKDRLLERIRARDPSKVYSWCLSSSPSSTPAPSSTEISKEPKQVDTSTCRVVSIRAFEQHMGRAPPKFGNRLIVQALVRFETYQKLDVYTKTGQLVTPANAEPKRVVEYLVFQKRMWYDLPWVVKDQLYKGL